VRVNLVSSLRRLATSLLVTGAVVSSPAQLRVANWNVTNYTSGRVLPFQTAIYGTFEGRAMAPDVLVGQEFISAAGVTNFLSILNTAPGSPADWAAAPFIDGPDTDSALFYRTSRVRFLNVTIAAVGGGTTANQPRHTYRYDIQPLGYNAPGSTVAIYSVHMKAGSASSDLARRLLEAQRIRDNAETLPAGWQFMVSGDMNAQAATQSFYVEFVGSQINNAGRVFDPISTPGSWENNSAFRFVHTQEPSTQMDSRHDQILLGQGLLDGQDFDYVGTFGRSYSTTTWNDVFHSYRCWGNDGQSYNVPIRTTTNTMVGPAIAQALIDSVNTNGHLPVFLDLRVPPVASLLTPRIDFGLVAAGQDAEQYLDIENVGDTELWNQAGIADLRFSLRPTSGLTMPAAVQIDPAGGAFTRVPVRLNLVKAGRYALQVVIDTNDPVRPTLVVDITATVVGQTTGRPQRIGSGLRIQQR